ncbi:MAG: PepSY domain-containing protein [Candidatus Nanohaloarchaea archaeon]
MDQEMSREERETLHKWGKARKIIDEKRIEATLESGDRYQFRIEGDSDTYEVGVDIDTGETFCPCPFTGDTCSHQIAAHLYLAGIGVENPYF